MFGTFLPPHMSGGVAFDPYGPEQPTYGPSIGDSALGHYVGAKGYDGGIHNSPFAEGRMKDPFSAPGQFNPFMFMRPRRRRLNFLSMVQITMLLFGIFALIAYLFGFSARLTAPTWCWFFFSFCLFLAVVCLVKAVIVLRKQRQEQWSTPWYLMNDDDTWFLFLGVAIAISCFLGLAVGEIIFGGYSQPYYTLSELHSYKDVDPIGQGKAYLDAGAVNFKKDSFVDRSRAIGYKDGSVYCVAPIKLGTDGVASNDFYAVGTDCCSGFPGDFNCFENHNDRGAHGGLRLVDDASIPFFKLAVMQADAEWSTNSPNPVFLTWTQDPNAKLTSYLHDAHVTYGWSLAGFFLFEVACIGMMSLLYWRKRLWG